MECYEHLAERSAGFVAGPAPSVDIGLDDYMDQRLCIKDSRLHFQLRQDIIEHLWAAKGDSIE